jgi:hypothetical protein
MGAGSLSGWSFSLGSRPAFLPAPGPILGSVFLWRLGHGVQRVASRGGRGKVKGGKVLPNLSVVGAVVSVLVVGRQLVDLGGLSLCFVPFLRLCFLFGAG